MLWKAFILVLCLWCTVYTASYGIFELKSHNKEGGAGVLALGIAVAVCVAGAVIVSL